jgi:hypothetical protein
MEAQERCRPAQRSVSGSGRGAGRRPPSSRRGSGVSPEFVGVVEGLRGGTGCRIKGWRPGSFVVGARACWSMREGERAPARGVRGLGSRR